VANLCVKIDDALPPPAEVSVTLEEMINAAA
jgi:hypothetical protein